MNKINITYKQSIGCRTYIQIYIYIYIYTNIYTYIYIYIFWFCMIWNIEDM